MNVARRSHPTFSSDFTIPDGVSSSSSDDDGENSGRNQVLRRINGVDHEDNPISEWMNNAESVDLPFATVISVDNGSWAWHFNVRDMMWPLRTGVRCRYHLNHWRVTTRCYERGVWIYTSVVQEDIIYSITRKMIFDNRNIKWDVFRIISLDLFIRIIQGI